MMLLMIAILWPKNYAEVRQMATLQGDCRDPGEHAQGREAGTRALGGLAPGAG